MYIYIGDICCIDILMRGRELREVSEIKRVRANGNLWHSELINLFVISITITDL